MSAMFRPVGFSAMKSGASWARRLRMCQRRRRDSGMGDVWTWVAVDADSKLVVSYLCGGRDAGWANDFMKDVASRLTMRVQITSDGHRAYAEAVEGAFGIDVDFAMLIKLYGAPSEKYDTRYSPSGLIGTRTAVLSGNPDPKHVSTSFVERQNLTMRCRCAASRA